MSCEGAYVTTQAVLTMQQFGLKRGPEILAYQLSAIAISGFLNTILLESLKQFEGNQSMFIVSFYALVLALGCNIYLDDEKKVKFTDFYKKD